MSESLHDETIAPSKNKPHTLRTRVTRSADGAAYVVSCENVTLESSTGSDIELRHYLRLPVGASLDDAARCGRDLADAFYAPHTLVSVLFGWGALAAARYRALPCDKHGTVRPDVDRDAFEWLAVNVEQAALSLN